MKKIVIIGGGAAGMTAAIAAAERNSGAKIHILEHKEIVGKKLLSTGNGRCNFTNDKMDAGCYYGGNPEIIRQLLERFGKEETLKFFRELGIFSKSKNGYYYPRSEQAAAVRELFELRLKKLGVHIRTGVHVKSIKREKDGFQMIISEAQGKRNPSKTAVTADKKTDGTINAGKVILCAGGMAAPALGSDGSGYELARRLGHTIIPVVPALVQLRARANPLKKASGVRTDATVRIYENQKLMGSDTGEVQITDYGISGIPVFQVSRHAAKSLYYKRPVRAELDFLPELPLEAAAGMLRSQKDRNCQKPTAELLLGAFNKKLIPCILNNAGIPLSSRLCDLSVKEMERLVHTCKHFRLDIDFANGFEHAQVCAGGVDLNEINPATMESLRCRNFYLAGEILDADGICGGYNLQWAWAGGYLAGWNAAAD